MTDDDKELTELAKKMWVAFCAQSREDYSPWDSISPYAKNGCIAEAKVARDHFAAKTPGMTEEKRREIISSLLTKLKIIDIRSSSPTSDEAEEWLVKGGFIPPRPTPTLGERFAALVRDCGTEKRLADKFDEIVGPFIELAKASRAPERTAYDQYDEWHERLKAQADAALANFEAKIGGKL